MKTFIFVTMMLFFTTNTAKAELITYFGEDIQGASEGTRLAEHPNADAAMNNFLSNLSSGVGTEDFEDLSIGTDIPGISFPGAGNDPITASIEGFAEIIDITQEDGIRVTGETVGGRYPISGTKYLDSGNFFSVKFSEPISAFGFYATDIGDFYGHVTLTFINNAITINETIPSTTSTTQNPGGTVIYYGFIDFDNAFDEVIFGNSSGDADFFGFDDFTIGTLAQVKPPEDSGTSPVPEPSTIFLVSFGLIGLGALKRRFFH